MTRTEISMQQSSKLKDPKIMYISIAHKIATQERDMNKSRFTHCSVVVAGAAVLMMLLAMIFLLTTMKTPMSTPPDLDGRRPAMTNLSSRAERLPET